MTERRKVGTVKRVRSSRAAPAGARELDPAVDEEDQGRQADHQGDQGLPGTGQDGADGGQRVDEAAETDRGQQIAELEPSGADLAAVLEDVEAVLQAAIGRAHDPEVAAVAIAVWRANWGELELEGGTADPVEHFRRLRSELRTIVQ